MKLTMRTASIATLALLVWGATPAAGDEYAPVRETLEACFICHGENGASRKPEFPILAGQHFYYLYVQMKDFKAGRREGQEMQAMLAEISRAEMKAMAKFFSEQTWPRIGFRGDADIARKGEVAAAAGQCVQCHRGGYEGNSGTPRLAGQHRQYLEKTLLDYKSKARANAPAKSSLMNSYSAEDLAAMAEFLADK
jgi:cytochrome c553